MSAPDVSPPLAQPPFELTADEARIAASRAALRRTLAGGLTASHLAPLAAFSLARKMPPRAVRENPDSLADFQKLLQAQGIELAWPSHRFY